MMRRRKRYPSLTYAIALRTASHCRLFSRPHGKCNCSAYKSPKFTIISDSAADLLTSEPLEFGEALPISRAHLIQRGPDQRQGNPCFNRRSESSFDIQQPPFKISQARHFEFRLTAEVEPDSIPTFSG
jgi:hypothetical protein